MAADLCDEVAMILDDGEAGVGLESTVLDLTGERPLLRRDPRAATHCSRSTPPNWTLPWMR